MDGGTSAVPFVRLIFRVSPAWPMFWSFPSGCFDPQAAGRAGSAKKLLALSEV